MSALACENLTVRVCGRDLLQNISLALYPGELLGIVGTNGAGKTTLLRALVGLTVPTVGRITLDGKALGTWARSAKAKQLAYLPQGHVVHWPLPGREVVSLGRLPHGDAHRESGRKAIEQAMQITDIQAFANTMVQNLSGGERSRVLLARVLAGAPAVLLADEPLAALDPAHQLRMMTLLRKQAQQGRSIAVVLHDLSLAARFCTRVVVLREGCLLADGTPASVFDDATLAQAFGIEVARFSHAGETGMFPWRLTSPALASVMPQKPTEIHS